MVSHIFENETILVLEGPSFWSRVLVIFLNERFELVELPSKLKKCCGCGLEFSEKFRQPPYCVTCNEAKENKTSLHACQHKTGLSITFSHDGPVAEVVR